MKMFAFLAFAVMLLAIYTKPANEKMETSSEVTALNFLLYRDSVMNYVFKNKITGSKVINNEDIEFPTGFNNRNWKASLQNNILYIYGSATQQEIIQTQRRTRYSHSVGQKKNDLFYPHYVTPPTVLPGFIKEGDLVSILEITE